MTLEERVKQLEASIADPDVRAATVVAFVRAALIAESLAEERAKVEALVARRREQAAERQRRRREELSRSVTDVTRDERDKALPSVTARDTVPPSPPSGSSLSLSSDPDPERAIPGAPARAAKAKVKAIAPPQYPEDFDAFWGISGTGSKSEALKAWMQVGRPDPAQLIPAWKRWQAIAWTEGFGVPHVSTWLRHFDWREEPKPRQRAGQTPLERGRPPPPIAVTTPKTPPETRGWGRKQGSETEPERVGFEQMAAGAKP